MTFSPTTLDCMASFRRSAVNWTATRSRSFSVPKSSAPVHPRRPRVRVHSSQPRRPGHSVQLGRPAQPGGVSQSSPEVNRAPASSRTRWASSRSQRACSRTRRAVSCPAVSVRARAADPRQAIPRQAIPRRPAGPRRPRRWPAPRDPPGPAPWRPGRPARPARSPAWPARCLPRLLLGLVPSLPGLVLGLSRPAVLGLVPRLPRLLLGLVPGLPGLRQGFVAVLLGLLAGVGGRVLAHPAGLAGSPGQLLAQAAHGLPDVLPDLADDVADRRGQLLLELVQLVAAAAQFLAPGLGDPVDLASVYLVVGDQALFLQPGQPRVDRARRGRVHAHEPVAQQPDDLVAVPGLLIEQPQQVQPEAAMAEYRTQLASPSISLSLSGCGAPVRAPCAAVRRSARRSSMTRPDMVLTDTCPEPAPRLPLTV